MSEAREILSQTDPTLVALIDGVRLLFGGRLVALAYVRDGAECYVGPERKPAPPYPSLPPLTPKHDGRRPFVPNFEGSIKEWRDALAATLERGDPFRRDAEKRGGA